MDSWGARPARVGPARAGSQLQLQVYVNQQTEALNLGILKALPAVPPNASLSWVSPLKEADYGEYRDRDFLKVLGLDRFCGELSNFWPRRGPVWDALAVVEGAGCPTDHGVLLVEAKSHPGEVYGNGCGASATPCKKIETAFDVTKKWLGVSDEANWTGPLYQPANRLAHLYFFREVVHVPAWLVNVYFLSDPYCRTGRKDWELAFPCVKAGLGLMDKAVPFTANLFLEARAGE